MMLSKDQFSKLSTTEMYDKYVSSCAGKEELKEILDQLKLALEKIDGNGKVIERLESELVLSKTVNDVLKKEIKAVRDELNETTELLFDTKKERIKDNQYGRRENVEIANIPKEIGNERLEETVIKVMGRLVWQSNQMT